MNRLPKEPHPFGALENCYIAGGAILSAVTKTEPADYDIYPKTKKAAIDIIYHLMEEESCFIVNISDRAVTLKSNVNTNLKGERILVQVMLFDDFWCPKVIFDFFDFTVCMAAFDCDTKKYWFHDDFWVDVAAKTLRFNPKTRYPLNSMMRIAKYRNKGYTLPTSEMIRMSLTLMQSDMPTSWEDLEQVIGGTYGRQVKLHTQDLIFSIENAIQFFDNLNVDMLYPNSDVDYSQFTADDFITVFDNDVEWYRLDEPSKGSFGTKCFLVSADGQIIADTHRIIELSAIFGVSDKFKQYPADLMLVGYKTFKMGPEGTLVNNVYSRKQLPYKIGEWTEEPAHPHIFVHQSPCSSYGLGIKYKVEFYAKDIVTVNTNELTVKKVRVVEKVG
jgi:hypothetical protein